MDDVRKMKLVEDIYGVLFLEYILDKEEYYKSKDKKIKEEMSKLCDSLYKVIEEAANKRGANLDMHISDYLFNIRQEGESYYNILRKRVGGDVPEIDDKDPLLNYLKKKCVEFYPSFLIKETNNYDKWGIPSFYFNYKDEDDESTDELIELIKNDSDLSKLLYEDHPDFGNVFMYELNGNKKIAGWDSIASFLTMRAYQDCVQRMQFSLDEVLTEVETQVLNLRKIAKGEDVDLIFFCGVKDIYFKNCEEFQISNNLTLRNSHWKHRFSPLRSKFVYELSVNLMWIFPSIILEYRKKTNAVSKDKRSYKNNMRDFKNMYNKLNESFVYGTDYPISIKNDIYFVDYSLPLNLIVDLKSKEELVNKEAVGISKEELESISAKFNRM